MFARSSTLGVLAVLALSLPSSDTSFILGASGAVNLAVQSETAQYGIHDGMADGPMISIDLGGNADAGTLGLYLLGDRVPALGRYLVQYSLDPALKGVQFHACFVAGTPEHPVGVFHAEAGWVTITRSEAGRLSGEYEIRARGFLAANMNDEDQWVTVRGSFEAKGDDNIATVESVAAAVR